MDITIFLDSLTNKIFKILPLKEQNNDYLFSHLNSLQIELIGALVTFPELKKNTNYLSIIDDIYTKENIFSISNQSPNKQTNKRSIIHSFVLVAIQQYNVSLGLDLWCSQLFRYKTTVLK